MKLWLISFLAGMILTTCNIHIKPEETRNVAEKPNDTLFLAEAYGYSKLGHEVASIASLKASDQKIRIFAEKAALFQQKIEQKWDSLSRKKNFSLPDMLTQVQKKDIKNLSNSKSDNFDHEFLAQMENQLISHIELLENVSTRSEDNEITTLAIALLPNLHIQLDSLVSLKRRFAVK